MIMFSLKMKAVENAISCYNFSSFLISDESCQKHNLFPSKDEVQKSTEYERHHLGKVNERVTEYERHLLCKVNELV